MGDAANAKHFTAPDPDGVDWLLLPALSTAGSGLFSRVTYIQRLYTDGGKSPAAGCGPVDQTEVLVEYSAQYFFYGPAGARLRALSCLDGMCGRRPLIKVILQYCVLIVGAVMSSAC